MKKLLAGILLLSSVIASGANNGPVDRIDKEVLKVMTTAELEERKIILEDRIAEISAMDLKSLAKDERKALRSEVRYIKKEMKAIENGGIYLSFTAIIIILLLLILLL